MTHHTFKRGFTLVEMIVSLAIFSIVAVVALTALMSIMAANRKAQTLQASITNLSYAMESISREMRVGTNYWCLYSTNYIGGVDLPSSLACNLANDTRGATLAFRSSESYPKSPTPAPPASPNCNLINVYRFVPVTGGYRLEKNVQRNCEAAILEQDYAPILDSKLVITDYAVKVEARTYPYAILRISGYAGEREKDRTYFDLQTAVSARTP